jgi:WD40 repeat protein
MRTSNTLENMQDRNLSVQSLDIYLRPGEDDMNDDMNKDELTSSRSPKLLIGTRAADIMEITLIPVFKRENKDNSISDKNNSNLSMDEGEGELETVRFKDKDERLLLRNHAVQNTVNRGNKNEYFNQKKLIMSAHPRMSILATIGNDKFLCIWETYHKEFIDRINLGITPSCLKWNPDGTLLVVGFNKGTVKVFESKTTKPVFNKNRNSELKCN